MFRPPPGSTRTDTHFPSTTLFRPRRLVDDGERHLAKSSRATSRQPRPNTPRGRGGCRRCARLDARGTRRCRPARRAVQRDRHLPPPRSEEHTSELQSLMRISYAVFCLKKKKYQGYHNTDQKPRTKSNTTHKDTNNHLTHKKPKHKYMISTN